MSRRPSKNWPTSGGRQWRKVRAYVLARDPECRLKYEGCTVTSTQAHHLDPRWKYGDDPARIIGACGPCNIKAGSPDVQPEPRPTTRW